MQLSVYTIYMLAWALALASVTLSAVILVTTFADVKTASDNTQLQTGLAQVITLNLTVATTLTRMKTETAGKLAQFLLDTSGMTSPDFYPDVVMGNVAPVLLQEWSPYVKAADFEIYGYIVNLLYPLNASSYTYDRCVQVYADILSDWSRQLIISITNNTDNLEYAHLIEYNGTTPSVGPPQYSFDWFPWISEALTQNDFYVRAWPWAASDGNAFWYFTYQLYYKEHGVEGTVQTMGTPYNWLDAMQAITNAGSEMLMIDSLNRSIVATPKAEAERLAACRGNFINGAVPTSCISIPADVHPTDQIRIPFNALFQPVWNDLLAPLVQFSDGAFPMNGTNYVAVFGTVFSRNDLRINVIWYQPAVSVGDNGGFITTLICVMTMLSTVVLTVLGIFGVLLPLMRLGQGLRVVARNLKDGNTGVAIERQRSRFTEVDAIGRDFETIVVDFLGFSTSKARDTANAHKDSNKPFTVVFTDIESSSLLWGRDPTQMARCLQLHHDLIRSLIQKHGMYEVKTVGDSFMITCTGPTEAVSFALDVQEEFYDFEWEWDEIEDVYQEFHSAFVKSPKSTGHGPRYAELWNGLRVRVGIHYGKGDVTYDDVVKGYDYYGPVVNTASRIESIGNGGQIIISESALKNLKTPVDPRRAVLNKLGVQNLRGITNPPPLTEIIPLRFFHRTHPPLRNLKHDDIMDDEVECIVLDTPSVGPSPDSGDGSTQASSISHEKLVATAEEIAACHSLVKAGVAPSQAIAQYLMAIRDTMESVTVPLGAQVQTATLKSICKGWGVAIPKSRAELAVSLLLVAQRLSESAKNIAQLQARFRTRAPMVSMHDV